MRAMASRLRLNPKHLFDLFVEICCYKDGEPYIRLKYPDSFVENDVLKQLPMFAFPCEIDSHAVEHFTFTLTDVEGSHRFGFCRLSAGGTSCLCIVSDLPWFDAFYKILNKMSDLFKNPEDDRGGIALLSALLEAKVPPPGEKCFVATHDGSQEMQFEAPRQDRLPSLFQDRNLMEYCSVFDYHSLITIFASMLNERRIIFTSLKIGRLSACIHACASLLYPMHWQHIFLPVLPRHLLDFCSAPMPYLIGVHAYLKDDVRKMDIGDAVLVDTDRNEVLTPHSDVDDLPHEVLSALKKRLKVKAGDDSVARAFLRALVMLIGGYREGARLIDDRIEFNPAAFLASRSASMRPYLEKMLNLQIFQQFVDERLSLTSKHRGFCDEFEKENILWQTKSSNGKYKDIVAGAKKIQKEGKDQITGLASKVKSKGRSAVKSLKRRLHEENKVGVSAAVATRRPQRMSSYKQSMTDECDHGGAAGTRPHGSAGAAERRPPRPPLPHADGGRRLKPNFGEMVTPNRRESYKEARMYRPMCFDDDDLVAPRVSMNLMEDPEIQSVVKKSYSLEDLAAAANCEENDSSSVSDGSVDLLSGVMESAGEDTPDHSEDGSGSPATPVAPPRRRRHGNPAESPVGHRIASSGSMHSSDDGSQQLPPQQQQQFPRSSLGGRGGSSSAPDLMDLLTGSCHASDSVSALPPAVAAASALLNIGPSDDAADCADPRALADGTCNSGKVAADSSCSVLGTAPAPAAASARQPVAAEPPDALAVEPTVAKSVPTAARRAPRIEQLQRELIEKVQQQPAAVAVAAASSRRQIAASYDWERLREALGSISSSSGGGSNNSETGTNFDQHHTPQATAIAAGYSSTHPLRPLTMFGRNKDVVKRQTIFGDPRHLLTPADEEDEPQAVTFAFGPSSLVHPTGPEPQPSVVAPASALVGTTANATVMEGTSGGNVPVHEDLVGLRLDLPPSPAPPAAVAQRAPTGGLSATTSAKPNYYVALPPATTPPPNSLPRAGGTVGHVSRQQPQSSSIPNQPVPSVGVVGSYVAAVVPSVVPRSLSPGLAGSSASYGAASVRLAAQPSDVVNVSGLGGSPLLGQTAVDPLKPKRLHHGAKPGAAAVAADPFADLVNLKSHLGVGRSGAQP